MMKFFIAVAKAQNKISCVFMETCWSMSTCVL